MRPAGSGYKWDGKKAMDQSDDEARVWKFPSDSVAPLAGPTLPVSGDLSSPSGNRAAQRAESNILSARTATKMFNTIKDSRLVEVPKAGHLVQGANSVLFEQVVR